MFKKMNIGEVEKMKYKDTIMQLFKDPEYKKWDRICILKGK